MKLTTTFLGTVLALALPASAALNPGNLPLWFEAGSAQFTAHGRDAQFNLTATGAEFTLRQTSGKQTTARMTFLGGSPAAKISGHGELAGKINRFIGNEPAQWQSGLVSFAQVRLEKIYPGVNVVYYGNQEKLEYDFDLAAGVNPEIIALRFDGIEKISVNAQGELVIALAGGEIIQHQPVAYQTIAGQRIPVTASYRILEDHTAAFAVGSYDHSQPLVIDPILNFTTYFGGNSGETAWAVAVNPADNSIYLAGQTFSTKVTNGVPFSANAIYPNYGGGNRAGDAFVAKFDSSGQNLIYCTYLGGKGDDAAYALAVDGSGHAFVAGATASTNFPTVHAAHYGNFNGAAIHGVKDQAIGRFPTDAFVTELEADGSALLYSTYLGGSSSEAAYGITVDPAGNAFVTGFTYSSNFPTTPAAVFTKLACTNNFYWNANAFVSEIAPDGQINYSTYLGGSNFDVGLAIAYNNGSVFVAGKTMSKNFPWTNGLLSSRYLNGRTNQIPVFDGFVTKFKTSGTDLELKYSTFLGSTNEDVATGVAADAAGNAYVVGWTTSTNFPTVSPITNLASFVHTNHTGFILATNPFLTVLSWNGVNAEATYSQTFGGRGQDVANGVALDSGGNVYVVGTASSTNFPVTFNASSSTRMTNSGASDAFVIGFAAGGGLLGSAYLGGRGNDNGEAIAIDSNGSVIIAGNTTSTNLPVINAAQPKRNGTNDTFISKFNFVM